MYWYVAIGVGLSVEGLPHPSPAGGHKVPHSAPRPLPPLRTIRHVFAKGCGFGYLTPVGCVLDFIPIKGWGAKDQDEDENYVRHNRFP